MKNDLACCVTIKGNQKHFFFVKGNQKQILSKNLKQKNYHVLEYTTIKLRSNIMCLSPSNKRIILCHRKMHKPCSVETLTKLILIHIFPKNDD